MAKKRKNSKRTKRHTKSLRDLNFEGPDFELSGETKRWIFIIVLFVFGLLGVLSLFDSAGTLGVYFNLASEKLFGVTRWIFPFVLLLVGYFLIKQKAYSFRFLNIVGLILFYLGLTSLIHIVFHQADLVSAANAGFGGGYFGLILSWPLLSFTGFWGTIIISLACLVIGFILLFEHSILAMLEKRREMMEAQEEEEDEEDEEEYDEEPVGLFAKLMGHFDNKRLEKAEIKKQGGAIYEDEEGVYEDEEAPEFSEQDIEVEQHGSDMEEEENDYEADDEEEEVVFKKTTSSSDEDHEFSVGAGKFKKIKVDLPTTLLEGRATMPKGGDLKVNKLIIQKTLKNFGIQAAMGDAKVGPTVTQYTLKPADGVRLSKITGLSDNLALALAAHPIRIEAPIPGLSLVGIEVPNETKASVPLYSILNSPEFKNRESDIEIALGKDVMGKSWLYPMDKMPHLLIAGATGSGKSVCINTLILSLLFQNGPDKLKFIMVDPKRVELPLYNGIPHLLTPVITDVKKTLNALRWTIKEMEKRFDVLSAAGHRNIASYNEENDDMMPYIIFVIDELADIMASAGPEVEAAIVRLAQMARAVGIHLVLATQRPSVDVITGTIKANIPARIAFSVASLIDSRTILDMAGAEKLLGKGDMLFMSADITKPKRIQGAFTSDKEIKKVITHLKKQADPDYIEDVTEKPAGPTGFSDEGSSSDDSDPLLLEAKDVIFKAKKASASLLQRRLRVGYARAARILDLLEAQGVIGPADGAKPREVFMNTDQVAPASDHQEKPEPVAVKQYEEEEEDDEDEETDYEEGEDDSDDYDENLEEEEGEDGEEDYEDEEDYEEEDDELIRR